MLRHLHDHGSLKVRLANHPKYRLMLLAAHGVVAAGNAGRVALVRNPLAINQAQWMAFLRYLLPSIKYWVFDRDRLRLEHMEAITDAGWTELEALTRDSLETAFAAESGILRLR